MIFGESTSVWKSHDISLRAIAHADSNSNSDSDCDCNVYTNPYSNGDGYIYSNTKAYSNTKGHSHAKGTSDAEIATNSAPLTPIPPPPSPRPYRMAAPYHQANSASTQNAIAAPAIPSAAGNSRAF